MTTAGEEAVLSIVYSSTASRPFDDAMLRGLLEQSRAANAEHEVTGMLLYRNGRFVQILEGPEASVRETMARIETDPRHHHVRVLIDEYLSERNFADWTMGFEPISASAEALPEGFRDTFDDLESAVDPSATLRAARELSLWFRVRANRPR